MKRYGVLAVSFGLLVLLVIPSALFSYDNSPNQIITIPECIWALATGGGIWVTELQITDMTFASGTVISARFYYGGGSYRSVINLWTSPGSGRGHSVIFSNILSTLQSLDSGFTYYGTVGALVLYTQDTSHVIQAQARTVNGNYGKTFQGLDWVDSNTANFNRPMMIMNLTQNATYRTFVGFFNATNGGQYQDIEFNVVDETGNLIGNMFFKTFAAWDFQSFNPFVEAGLGSGTYDNCWLYIWTTASGNSGTGTMGLFCFGSSANNYTNDTSSHIAVQVQ